MRGNRKKILSVIMSVMVVFNILPAPVIMADEVIEESIVESETVMPEAAQEESLMETKTLPETEDQVSEELQELLNPEEYEKEREAERVKAEEAWLKYEEELSGMDARPMPFSISFMDYQGDGTEENPYQIDSAARLWDFAAQVNKGNRCKNLHFKVTKDIRLDDDGSLSVWTPMERFDGVFDGDGHVISGLSMDSDKLYQGLFGFVVNGTITNVHLRLSNVHVSGGNFGGIAGVATGSEISNCSVKGHIITETAQYVGGVIGMSTETTISGVKFLGSITGENDSIGGIAGVMYSGSMTGCTVEGEITGWEQIGGMIGQLYSSPSTGDFMTTTISSNYNKAKIYGNRKVGGLIGSLQNNGDVRIQVNVYENANIGKITANMMVGGMIGDVAGNLTIIDCYNNAPISATTGSLAGGIIGRFNSDVTAYAHLSYCYNAGEIQAKNKWMAGGIAGYSAEMIVQSYILINGVAGIGYAEEWAEDSEYNIRKLSSEELKTLGGEMKSPFIQGKDHLNDGYPLIESIQYEIETEEKDNEFIYASETLGVHADYRGKYYYQDDYFYEDSSIYKNSLATMSLCLAMSAFASNEAPKEEKSKNVKKLLGDIGFQNIEVNEAFTVYPERDSIGVAIGHKQLNDGEEDYQLLAVAIRGAGYAAEWSGNLRMGETGEHEGFRIARDTVLEFLDEYVDNHGIDGPIKIWITGYSRASAVTNLTAAELLNRETVGGEKEAAEGEVQRVKQSVAPENIYAYGFEVPAGTLYEYAREQNDTLKEEYKYIHSIVNLQDIVPKVAPQKLDFTRYGYDYYLPMTGDDSYESMKRVMVKRYAELESTNQYIVEDFCIQMLVPYLKHDGKWGVKVVDNPSDNTTQKDFLDNTITNLVEDVFISRSNYVEKYQSLICDTLGNVFAEEKVDMTKFAKLFAGKAAGSILQNLPLAVIMQQPKVQIVQANLQSVKSILMECFAEMDMEVKEESINQVAEALTTLLVDFALENPSAVVTFMGSSDTIAAAHYPELCLAWLQSMDINYTKAEELTHFSNGSSRKIVVNCPVDIEVYDSSNHLVASIIADEPQRIEGQSMISSFNEHGEKIVSLSAAETYSVKLKATGEGTMTYTVNEHNPVIQGVNRVVSFYDVPIQTGEEYTAVIPAFDEEDLENGTIINGSGAVYTLQDPNGRSLDPDAVLSGETARDAVYRVDAFTENGDYGLALGQGTYRLGSYAKVEAYEQEGYTFDGWYEGDEKVSEAAKYRFRVERDVSLTAKFNKGMSPVRKGCIEISTPDELRAVADRLNGSYKLVNDIDLAGELWEPIQNFSGVFDGNGYKIINVKIDKPNSKNVGFFGSTTTAFIQNVALENIEICAEGSSFVGGLIGMGEIEDPVTYNDTSNIIKNCSISGGKINGREHVGGLIGRADKTIRIYRCYVDETSSVHGVSRVGGLMGSVERYASQRWCFGYIEECFSKAVVRGSEYVGGLTGHSIGGNYANCYADGDVAGEHFVGGLFGDGYFSDASSRQSKDEVRSCHFSGKGSGFTSVLGINQTSGTSGIQGVYFTGEVVFSDTSLTAEAESLSRNAFCTYISDAWVKNKGSKPYLRAVQEKQEGEKELGTVTNPYLVATPEDLSNIRNNLTAHYKLVSDIDLMGMDWKPIGLYDANRGYREKSFSGSLDGDGYTIKNAVIRGKYERDTTALFGASQSATFRNLRLENFDVRGNYWTGGLIAQAMGETLIENCSIDNSSVVVGSYKEVLSPLYTSYRSNNSGGLFGSAQSIRVTDCHSAAQIGDQEALGAFGTEEVGGIGGAVTSIVMQRCSFEGMIYGKIYVGGLVGDVSSGILEDCYFDGEITAYKAAMGISHMTGSAYQITRNCYTTGNVEVEDKGYPFNPYGYNSNAGNIESCYYNKDSLNTKYCLNTGRTLEELKKKETYRGWDFENVWYIEEGTSLPKLR
jgi:hypothetical protein